MIVAPRRSPRTSNEERVELACAEHLEQHRAAALEAQAVGAHAREAQQRVLGGDLRVASAQRRVGHLLDAQLVLEPLGVGEAHRPVLDLARDAQLREPLAPERERVRRRRRARSRGTRDPGPTRPGAAPGYSKKVMSDPGSPSSSA